MGMTGNYDTQRRRPAFKLEDCPEEGDAEKTAENIFPQASTTPPEPPPRPRGRAYGPPTHHQAMYALLRERDQLLCDLDKPDSLWWNAKAWADAATSADTPFARPSPSLAQSVTDTWQAFWRAGTGQFSEAKKARIRRIGEIERELDRVFPDHNAYLLQKDVKHLRQDIARCEQERTRLQSDAAGQAADLVAALDIELAALAVKLQAAQKAVVANDMAMVHAGISKNAQSYDTSTSTGKLRFAAEMMMAGADLGGAALPMYWDKHGHTWGATETSAGAAQSMATSAIALPTVEQLHQLWFREESATGRPLSLEQKVAQVVDSLDPDQLRTLSPDAPDLDTVRAVIRQEILRQLRPTAEAQTSSDAAPAPRGRVDYMVVGAASPALATWASRHRIVTIVAGLLITVIVSALATWYWRRAPSPRQQHASGTSASDLAVAGVTTDASDLDDLDSTHASGSAANGAASMMLDGVTTDASEVDQPAAAASTWLDIPQNDQQFMPQAPAAPAHDTAADSIKKSEAISALRNSQDLLKFADAQISKLLEGKSAKKTVQALLMENVEPAAPVDPFLDLRKILADFLAHGEIDVPPPDKFISLYSLVPLHYARQELKSMLEEIDRVIERIDSLGGEDLSKSLALVSKLKTLPPAGPRQRDMWKALTNGRNLWALNDLKLTLEYNYLLRGVELHLTQSQMSIENDLTGPGFLAQAGADFFRAFKKKVDDPYFVPAQKYREWEAKVIETYQKLINGDHGEIYRNYLGMSTQEQADWTPEQKATFEKYRKILVRHGLQLDLELHLKSLPAALIDTSSFEKFKTLSAQRMQAMQGGRLVGSLPALSGSLNRLVEALYATSSYAQISASIGVAEEFFASIKVPWGVYWAVREAAKAGDIKFWTAFNQIIIKPMRDFNTRPAEDQSQYAMNEFARGRGNTLTVRKQEHLGKKAAKTISSVAKHDPVAWVKGKQLTRELRNQLPFMGQDISALALSIYQIAVSPPQSDAEMAERVMKILSAFSYVTGTASLTFITGTGATSLSRGANVAGWVLNVGAGIANIIKIDQKGGPNRQRDIALASVQLVADTIGVAGSLMFPVIGSLLVIFIPNFNSIGMAMDYHETARQLYAEGRNLEGFLAIQLRNIAIADAVPVVNWFSFLYRPITMEIHRLPEVAIIVEVANSVMRQLESKRSEIAPSITNDINTERTLLVMPMNFVVDYTRANPNVLSRLKTLSVKENVTMWVAVGKNPGEAYTFPETIMHTTWTSDKNITSAPTAYAGLQREPAITDSDFARRIDSAGITLTEGGAPEGDPPLPEVIIVHRPAQASSLVDSIPLNLNNEHSPRSGIYIVEKGVKSSVRITAGNWPDVFRVHDIPKHIDGNGGVDKVIVDNSTQATGINFDRLTNIENVEGAAATRTVRGDAGDATYTSAPGNTHENIDLSGVGARAVVSGGDIKMGPGDNFLFATNIPRSADGGSGHDMLTFSTFTPTSGIELIGNTMQAAQDNGESRQGSFRGFETVRLTNRDDSASLYKDTDIRVLHTLDGNDRIDLTSVSDMFIFFGKGNNSLSARGGSDDYSNLFIYGFSGSQDIGMELQNSKVEIVTGDQNDSVLLQASEQTTNNTASLDLGAGDNEFTVTGAVDSYYYVNSLEGAHEIVRYANPDQALHLVFGGDIKIGDIDMRAAMVVVTEDEFGPHYQLDFRVRNDGILPTQPSVRILTQSMSKIDITTQGDGKHWSPMLA